MLVPPALVMTVTMYHEAGKARAASLHGSTRKIPKAVQDPHGDQPCAIIVHRTVALAAKRHPLELFALGIGHQEMTTRLSPPRLTSLRRAANRTLQHDPRLAAESPALEEGLLLYPATMSLTLILRTQARTQVRKPGRLKFYERTFYT